MNDTAALGELVVTVLGLVAMYVAYMRYRRSRRTKPDRDKGPSVTNTVPHMNTEPVLASLSWILPNMKRV